MIYEEKVRIDGTDSPFLIHFQNTEAKHIATPAHMHEYIEMLYATAGKFEMWLNGVYYTFEKGDLVVINSREVHHVNCISEENGGYICARFVPEMLYTSSASAFEIKYVTPFIMNGSKHQRIFKKNEIENTFIPYLMHEMRDEYDKKQYGYELAVKTDISRIFLWIVRYWHARNADISNEYEMNEEMIGIIKKVLEYVSENYGDDIKAYEIAGMCNLSYSYFSRIFKQYMKKSFSEYVNFIRIMNAEKLLVSTDRPITDIASECGFGTSSYFIKLFRQSTGMSPMHFRKSAASG